MNILLLMLFLAEPNGAACPQGRHVALQHRTTIEPGASDGGSPAATVFKEWKRETDGPGDPNPWD